MMYYGGATEGMRTMLDALIPATKVYIFFSSVMFCVSLITICGMQAFMETGNIADAAAKAKAGMEATKSMGSLAGT